jgi:hypothetical protein
MKIYRVYEDVNNYQSLFLKDDSLWDDECFNFNARPKGSVWKTPSVFILEPNLIKGNFYYFTPGVLVADITTCEQLSKFIKTPSCELLPLQGKKDVYNLINVIECVDVLDEDKTEWEYGKITGNPIRIKHHYFNPENLTEGPLFKIPQTCKTEIYTCEGLKDPEDEFKYTIENNNIRGLIFEEVWRDYVNEVMS